MSLLKIGDRISGRTHEDRNLWLRQLASLLVFPGFVLALSLVPHPAHAQAWSGIIDSTRAIDWTRAGIPGGLPTRTIVCETVLPSGKTDSTDMTNIDDALAACGTNQVVELEAGTFTITGGLIFDGISNVTLRGVGPDKTKLIFTGTASGCNTASDVCIVGNRNSIWSGFSTTLWTNGYSKDETVLTVSSTSGLSVGQTVILDQRNDSIGQLASPDGEKESGDVVTVTTSIPHGFRAGQTVGIGSEANSTSSYDGTYQITGVPSPTTFQYISPAVGLAPSGGEYVTVDTGGAYVCDVHDICIDKNQTYLGRYCPPPKGSKNPACAPGEISRRSQFEVKQITAINGNQITVDPPLEAPNWRSSQSPAIWWTGAYATMDGIESMTLDFTDDGNVNSVGVGFNNAYGGWVKNVRAINAGYAHVQTTLSGRIEVVDSYFYGTKASGTNSYGINAYMSSDLLVQNNIFQHVEAMMPEDDLGSVYSYNYSIDNGNADGGPGWLGATLYSNHGFATFDLFEGNDATGSKADQIHGTGTGLTFFRDRLRGQDTPAMKDHLLAVQDDAYNRSENYVGNVLGTTGAEPGYEITSWNDLPSGFVYQLSGPSGKGSPVSYDPLVTRSLLRWGNYDVATAAVRWCGDPTDAGWSTTCHGASEVPTTGITFINGNPVPASRALPSSFYTSAAPYFWSTPWGTPPWPAIGPDVTGGTAPDGAGGHSYSIPAQLCYANTSVDPAYRRSFKVSSASWSAGRATLTIGQHSIPANGSGTIRVSGVSPAGYNGTFQVSAGTSSTISYSLPHSPGSYASGGTVSSNDVLLYNAAACYKAYSGESRRGAATLQQLAGGHGGEPSPIPGTSQQKGANQAGSTHDSAGTSQEPGANHKGKTHHAGVTLQELAAQHAAAMGHKN